MTLSAGEREAYARVGVNVTDVWTIEMRHSTFASTVRIANYHSDITHTLEAGAPVDASTPVLFAGLAFEFEPPSLNDDPSSIISARVDGVPGTVQPYIATAFATAEPLEVTVRELIYNMVTDTVLFQPVTLHLQAVRARSTLTSIHMEMGRMNAANQNFPNSRYTTESNPGLQ